MNLYRSGCSSINDLSWSIWSELNGRDLTAPRIIDSSRLRLFSDRHVTTFLSALSKVLSSISKGLRFFDFFFWY